MSSGLFPMPWPTAWDAAPWATTLLVASWVSRHMARDEAAAGLHAGALTGLRLALGCALAGLAILGVGLAWGGGRQGFTALGWMGVLGLAMGCAKLMRLLQGRKAWLWQEAREPTLGRRAGRWPGAWRRPSAGGSG